MLKQIIKNAKEEKARNEKIKGEKNYPALSIELFDAGKVYDLSKEEMRALLQEAIYLLIEKDQNAEDELIEKIEEWHPELVEEDEEEIEEEEKQCKRVYLC